MKTIIQKLIQLLEKPSLKKQEFFESLQYYFEELFQLNAENSRLFNLTKNELQEILHLSLGTRLKLKERLNGFVPSPVKEDNELISRVYNMNRALRYLEDYVLEVCMTDQLSDDFVYKTLHGEGAYFIVAPSQEFSGPEDLRSGDVILSRGGAFASAAIARMGTNDTQFSHLSFVYRNPKENGKLYTIEAHIAIGSVVEPFQVHIDQHNARTVVYRFQDPEIAHQAAEFMFEKVKTQSETGKNIEYNFSYQLDDSKRLFCSQVIFVGFEQVSGKTIELPKFKTRFNKGLITFLNRLDIPATHGNLDHMRTFSPGDIEYDPRFSLVAEWKDPKQLRDTRIKDAVLTKMYQWMENDQYHVHTPLGIKIISKMIWHCRRIPLVRKLIEKKLPLNMTVDQLRIILTIDKIGSVLSSEVSKVQATREHPLSIKEVFDVLEDIREKDQRGKGDLIHHWFNRKEV